MGDDTNAAEWAAFKSRFTIGEMVEGTVTAHAPFGIFLDVGNSRFPALVEVLSMADPPRPRPLVFPVIGSTVRGVLLGFHEVTRQARLSLRPSVIAASERDAVE